MDIFVQEPAVSADNNVLGIVEDYKSCVWTVRHAEYGDFELVLPPDSRSLPWMVVGNELYHLGDRAVMRIESVNEKTNLAGESEIRVSGRSWESFLLQRGIKSIPFGGAYCQLTGVRISVIAAIVWGGFGPSATNPADHIPRFTSGGGVAPPEGSITVQLDPGDIYTAVRNLCAPYDLGIRVYKGADPAQPYSYYFATYLGVDRTSKQSTNPIVSFGQILGNVSNVETLKSTVDYANVAYVYWGENFTMETVYPIGVPGVPSGIDRRVVTVNATDIRVSADLPLAQAREAAKQRGLSELAKHRNLELISADAVSGGPYIFNQDYLLGDIVEVWDGESSARKRVTEYIWTSDVGGENAYPTFSEIIWDPS